MRGFTNNLFCVSVILLGGALTGMQAGPAVGEKADPSHDPGVSLTGTWEGRLHGSPVTMVFKADGAGAINGAKIRWELRGEILTLRDRDDESQTFKALFDAKKLKLSGGELEERMAFTRRDGERLAKATPDRGAAESSPGLDRPSASRKVVINGEKLSDETIARLQGQLRVRIFDGAYWYDPACGAWGIERGPTIGFIPAGLRIGGALRSDASAGTTWVFVNGRQLPWQEVFALQRLTPVRPGRYWLDASGNVGYEGSPAVLLNLVQLSSKGGQAGGSYHSRSDITGIGSGGDGRTSYVMGKDFSVMIGD
jgi:hypothetical protein